MCGLDGVLNTGQRALTFYREKVRGVLWDWSIL